MFIGHFGVAFGAKKYISDVSLGFLFLACQLADLIWPSLVQLGIESFKVEPGNTVLTPLNFTHYPYSHSLLGLFIWGALLAGLYSLLRRSSTRAAIVIVLVVLSHWLLDYLTHRQDMPISFNEKIRVGLGLWNFPIPGIALELLLFGIGIWLYVRHTRARDKIGQYGLWGVVIFLLVIYFANIFGPPPPSMAAVAWTAQALWLLVALGFWIDRHRSSVIP